MSKTHEYYRSSHLTLCLWFRYSVRSSYTSLDTEVKFMRTFCSFLYSSTLTYMVDANAGRSSAAYACNTCFRGFAGIIASEIAAPLQDSIGDGGLYSIWVGLLVFMDLTILLVLWKGKAWREQAEKKDAIGIPASTQNEAT
jgi:hypothetical protein